MNKILITGGASTIGLQVVRRFVTNYPDLEIITVDRAELPLSANALNELEQKPNYKFVQGDLTDTAFVDGLFKLYRISAVINLVGGANEKATLNVLNCGKKYWKEAYFMHRFYHVATEDMGQAFSSANASFELIVMDYYEREGMDIVISNCSTYSDSTHTDKPIPVYTEVQEISEWLWVEDQACAIDVLFHQAESGHFYNIGGQKEWWNAQKVNSSKTL